MSYYNSFNSVISIDFLINRITTKLKKKTVSNFFII